MSTTHAVVTGATNGIGLAIARRLVREGLHVTLVGRDADKLAGVQATLGDERSSTAQADFAVLEQVRALAGSLPDADVVVSNAATVAALDAMTIDGHQQTLQVNHLAPYLLLRSLMERDAPPSRMVLVGAHPVLLAGLPVDLDHLDAPPPLPADQADTAPFGLYARTKNMTAMTMVALARRATRTMVVGAHPGIIGGTDLTREVPDVQRAVHARHQIDASALPGPDTGADTPAWLSTTDRAQHGHFYVERQIADLADHVTDPARVNELWQRSAQLVDASTATLTAGRGRA